MSGCPTYRRHVWSAQDEFLEANSNEYFELFNACASHKVTAQFFNDIFYRWFRLWPPERALFPGVPTNSQLSADQALAVMYAVRRTKLVSRVRFDPTLFADSKVSGLFDTFGRLRCAPCAAIRACRSFRKSVFGIGYLAIM